jgi:hypothetical protein
MTRSRLSVAVALVAALPVLACSDPGFYINVGVQNTTDVTLRVDMSAGGRSSSLSCPAGAYVSTEVDAGDGTERQVDFSVGGSMVGSGTCTATNEIVGTETYGQVNLVRVTGDGVAVECSSGWVENM